MTKVHAYLARIKDQEKDVIAVPDGAGRALCVSLDKHWTLTREWDELHIIAPLVEGAAEARTTTAPLREEWAAAWERHGATRIGSVQESPEDIEGVPPGGWVVHRYVSDWMPADPAEGDGIDRSEGGGKAATSG